MKSSELDYLYHEKLLEGKGSIRASKEIKSLEDHEKAFKILWKENQSLKKEIERLSKKVDKKNGFKAKFKELKTPEVKVKIMPSNVHNLNRIINFMEKDKHYSINELASKLCLSSGGIKEMLNFLNNHKILKLEYPEYGVIRR